MLTFPTFPGQGWSVRRRTIWNTRLDESASGREVRTKFWRYPRYEFEVVFDALSSSEDYPGLQARSKQNLEAFVHQCAGRANAFVYHDSIDNYVDGGALGIGDGATIAFSATRSIASGFAEPVGWVENVSAVYLNGVATDAWSLTHPNTIALSAPPAAGVVVTADFWFGFLCRLDDDETEFEEFLSHLHRVQSFKFKTVRSK